MTPTLSITTTTVSFDPRGPRPDVLPVPDQRPAGPRDRAEVSREGREPKAGRDRNQEVEMLREEVGMLRRQLQNLGRQRQNEGPAGGQAPGAGEGAPSAGGGAPAAGGGGAPQAGGPAPTGGPGAGQQDINSMLLQEAAQVLAGPGSSGLLGLGGPGNGIPGLGGGLPGLGGGVPGLGGGLPGLGGGLPGLGGGVPGPGGQQIDPRAQLALTYAQARSSNQPIRPEVEQLVILALGSGGGAPQQQQVANPVNSLLAGFALGQNLGAALRV